MIRKLMRDKVFSISAIIITLLAVLGALMPDAFGNTASMLYNLTTNNFGWFYLLSIFVIIVFLIWVAASKYGTIRLGGEKEKPQYPFLHGSECCSQPVSVWVSYSGA